MAYTDITALPPAPQRSDSPDDFVAKADAHVASLTTLVTEMNAGGGEINAIAASLSSSEANAVAAADAAIAAANYKGDYVGGTTYNVGESVTESNVVYHSKVSGNTGNLPSSSPTQWLKEPSTIANIVEDPTPRLGGELDSQSNKIINLGNATAATDAVNLAQAQATALSF